MAEHPTVAILWFRQDLRLSDNAALHAACAAADRVLPVYVLPESQASWGLGGASAWWLHHSLASLAASLAEKGASLCLRRGNPAAILADLAETHGAHTIHAGICVEPAWRAQDDELAAKLAQSGRALTLHRNARLFDPDGIQTKAGGIYGMYTPFANAVLALGAPPAPLGTPKSIPGVHFAPPSDRLDDWALLPSQPGLGRRLARCLDPRRGRGPEARRLVRPRRRRRLRHRPRPPRTGPHRPPLAPSALGRAFPHLALACGRPPPGPRPTRRPAWGCSCGS